MASLINDLISYLIAGEAISERDALYMNPADGKVYKLDVTDETKKVFIGIAKSSGVADDPIKVTQSGRIKGFTGLTAGVVVYASTTTPGSFQLVEPSNTEKLVLGTAVSSTELVINAALSVQNFAQQGAGDAGTLHLVRAADLADPSDIDLQGNNADIDGGGSIVTAPTLSTTAADLILNDSVIKYNPDADGSNDYFGFTKAIPQGLRGRSIKFMFEYKNDSTTADDDFRFGVKQKDGTLADSIEYYDMEAFYDADGISKLFFCESFIAKDCTEVEIAWQNTSTTTTVELYVDNILISSSPERLENIEETNEISYSQDSTTEILLTGTTDIVEFNDLADFVGNDKNHFTISTVSGASRFTANRTVSGTIAFSSPSSQANARFSVLINGTVVQTGSSNGAASNYSGVTTPFHVDQGDYIEIQYDGSAYGTASGNAYLSIVSKATNESVATSANAGTEVYRATYQSNFWDGTGLQDTIDTSLIPLNDSKLLEWNDTTETRLVAKKAVIVNVSVLGNVSADQWVVIRDSNGLSIGMNRQKTDAAGAISTSAEFKLEKGDYVYFEATLATGADGGITISARPEVVELMATIPFNYTQTKVLSADHSTNDAISDLQFDNLIIGNFYTFHFNFKFYTNADDEIYVTVANGATTLTVIADDNVTSGEFGDHTKSMPFTFQATDTSVTFTVSSAAASAYVVGNGTRSETHVTIIEENYMKETNRF